MWISYFQSNLSDCLSYNHVAIYHLTSYLFIYLFSFGSIRLRVIMKAFDIVTAHLSSDLSLIAIYNCTKRRGLLCHFHKFVEFILACQLHQLYSYSLSSLPFQVSFQILGIFYILCLFLSFVFYIWEEAQHLCFYETWLYNLILKYVVLSFFSCFLDDSYSEAKRNIMVVLVCISLMTKDAKHLFSYNYWPFSLLHWKNIFSSLIYLLECSLFSYLYFWAPHVFKRVLLNVFG